MALTRELPSNKSAEKYVISASLADVASANYTVNELVIEDFTDRKYICIFKALKSLYFANKVPSIGSIITSLEELNYLEEVGGSDYLNDLLNDFIDTDSLEDNIRILQDKRIARDLIVKMDALIDNYYNHKYETDFDFLNNSELSVNEVCRTRKVEGFKGIAEVSKKIKENIEIARQNSEGLIGLDTGYHEINKFTSGMQAGQMVVLAARPGVGKTALGLNISFNIAKKYKRPVLIFSAEMGEEEVITRIISNESNINGNKIATGNITKDETLKLNKAIKDIENVPLLVSYCNGTTIGEIVNKTTKFKSEHPDLAMIMVDYIGLIRTGQKEESTRIEIGKISHALKKLSLDLQIPVIVVSQVRRTENAVPQMSDLKESGDIEQDADKVILLYRDDYEQETKKKRSSPTDNQANINQVEQKAQNAMEQQGQEKQDNGTSIVEVIVAKNRNGSTGVGYLFFFKAFQRFGNPTEEFIQDYKLKKQKMTSYEGN